MQLGAVRALIDTRLLQSGQQPEMPTPSAYQCLFCNHLNPVGESFCNECGSQLQLQQCDLCGSINKRSARVCYKCGAAFTFAAPIGTSAVTLDSCTPATALNPVHTTLPESLLDALDARHARGEITGLRGNLPKPYAKGGPVVDCGEPTDISPAVASSAATGLPSGTASVAANRLDYRHPLAMVAVLLLFVMGAAYVMRGSMGPESPVPSGSTAQPGDASVSIRASSSAVPARSEVSVNTLPRSPVADELGVPDVAHGAAVSDENNDARGKSDANRESVTKACLPAVAALGLCEGVPVEEKK